MLYNKDMAFSFAKNKHLIILLLTGVIFLCLYSILPVCQWRYAHEKNQIISYKFNTPDEVINHYFSQSFANSGQLFFEEPLNIPMHRVIFPRWALVVENKITPGNFLGLDLIYGSLAKIFRIGLIPYLTPFFAIWAVIFFYFFLQHFWSKSMAFFSALLMYVFPPFWYYASRTMFPNVLFLSLLITGLYFFVKLLNFSAEHKKSRLLFSGLAGLFLGLSLIVRTSEIIWVGLILLILVIYQRQKLKSLWPYIIFSALIFVFCFVPVFYHQKILYNNFLSTGYPLTTVSPDLETSQVSSISWLKAVVLPFGFHPRQIIFVLYHYVIKLLWPWLISWLLGLILFFRAKKTPEQKKYFVILLLLSFWLLIYYGSWRFYDSAVPGLISLGSSYLRYFLPLFIFALPLVAWLLIAIYKFINHKILASAFLILSAGCLIVFSFNQVLFSGPESILSIKKQLLISQDQVVDIVKYTRVQDIILVSLGGDKVIFPERPRVIVPQNGVEWPEIRANLSYLKDIKFYYFDTLGQTSISELNEKIFNPEGLQIIKPQLLNPQGILYQIINFNPRLSS